MEKEVDGTGERMGTGGENGKETHNLAKDTGSVLPNMTGWMEYTCSSRRPTVVALNGDVFAVSAVVVSQLVM